MMGLKNLWRRKLRTSLTILGVVIGTAAIIIMVSLGIGLERSFVEMLRQEGDLTIIQVSQRPRYEGMGMGEDERGAKPNKKKDKVYLDDKAIANFKALSHVVAVSPMNQDWGLLGTTGKMAADVQLTGLDPAEMEKMGYKLSEGRLLNENDKDAIVVGYNVIRSFEKRNKRNRYDGMEVYIPPENRDPIDITKNFFFTYDHGFGMNRQGDGETEYISYKKHKVKIVGVLEKTQDWQKSDAVFINLKTMNSFQKDKEKVEKQWQQSNNRQTTSKDKYKEIHVKVDDMQNVEAVNALIKEMGYNTFSAMDILATMKKTSSMIQAVLGAIGGVSLLIAAIGITNTMIMSIYERTKEIGVMKVIGASITDIKYLFLFEASMIGAIGGGIGALISKAGSSIINTLTANNPGLDMGTGAGISYIPIWLMVAGVGMTAVIGIISGYFPARRAMRLSALEAIRTE